MRALNALTEHRQRHHIKRCVILESIKGCRYRFSVKSYDGQFKLSKFFCFFCFCKSYLYIIISITNGQYLRYKKRSFYSNVDFKNHNLQIKFYFITKNTSLFFIFCLTQHYRIHRLVSVKPLTSHRAFLHSFSAHQVIIATKKNVNSFSKRDSSATWISPAMNL